MTIRVLLVRHAAHDLLGKVLCGRTDGVALNAAGLEQADGLGQKLSSQQISRIYSSPTLRAAQTANAIARRCACSVQMEAALDEIDMGAWTGASFDALSADPAWRDWNTERSRHRPPAGESMQEVQSRLTGWLQFLSADEGTVVVAVSHADVIKAACCAALGLSLDRIDRFDIDACSVTELHAGSWGMKLACLNHT